MFLFTESQFEKQKQKIASELSIFSKSKCFTDIFVLHSKFSRFYGVVFILEVTYRALNGQALDNLCLLLIKHTPKRVCLMRVRYELMS